MSARMNHDRESRAVVVVIGVGLLSACSASGTGDGGQGGGAAGARGTGGAAGAGGTSARGGAGSGIVGTGGAIGMGGATSTTRTTGTGGSRAPDAAVGADATGTGCDTPGLVWKTAAKTEYTSFPDPGSPECIEYSGCDYMGMFAACSNTATEDWVATHNIVAAFPDFATLKLHDLCLKSGAKTIVVTVIDTCGDSDCGGCCTRNKGTAEELIDIESYTAARFGVPDGRIQWADLGPTKGQACP